MRASLLPSLLARRRGVAGPARAAGASPTIAALRLLCSLPPAAKQKGEVTRLICNPDALQLPDASLDVLTTCPNISFLILTSQWSEAAASQPAPACWQQLPRLLARLPGLSCIDISNCGATDSGGPRGLPPAARRPPTARCCTAPQPPALTLAPARPRRPAELQAIGASCSGLRGIDVSFNPGISDEGLGALLAACPQLQELDLSNCCSLSGAALASVARSCACLNALYAEQREVDEESAEEFAVACVSAAGLEAVARGCPALKVRPRPRLGLRAPGEGAGCCCEGARAAGCV